jgi:hypothetical protein
MALPLELILMGRLLAVGVGGEIRKWFLGEKMFIFYLSGNT